MRFTRAIVCPPAESFDTGITSAMLGPPDWELAREQHDAYCRMLERLGLTLASLPPDPTYPDGTFVEDAAVVTSRVTVAWWTSQILLAAVNVPTWWAKLSGPRCITMVRTLSPSGRGLAPSRSHVAAS